jgi:PAS domain S-box-containing protein
MTATPIRVLLLEDNPGDARLLRAGLAKEAPGKFTITTAERLSDALARIGAESFDLVLCDLGLPDSEGLATPRAIVATAPALPLIVLTGSHNEDLGRAAIRVGAQDYMVKGETKLSIARTLHYAIERKRMELELRAANETLEQRVAERTADLVTAIDSLRESEERFRSLTEMSSDFYWESDAEHRLTMRGAVDNKVSTVSVFQRGAQIGERRWEIPSLSPDAAGWQAHRAVLDAHLPFCEFELSRLGIDGTERFISISGDPVFDAAGAFKGYRGVGTDVTARKLAEEDLRAAADKFQALVEQSIAGIYIIQDGKLAYVNPRAASIVGQGSVDELIGTDPLTWIVEADRDQVAEHQRQLFAGEAQNLTLNFGALRRDGVVIQVGANAALATHNGRPAIIGLLQDISEKKRAEEQIQHYVAQLETSFMSSVQVATTLSEMRDPYTAGHERRVAAIAVAIGAELGLDSRRQEGLRVAGHLHDVGKINIPSEILSKPSRLSPIEFQLIQGHAQAGYDVLKTVEFPWPVAEVALQHHERMDGSGYPQGLKGDAILLDARIIAVADVVEAMSSHRPYRPGLGIDKALAEIARGSGSAYDPAVAAACLKLYREKGYAIPD